MLPKTCSEQDGPVMGHQALWPRYQENLKRQVGARAMFYRSRAEHEGDAEVQVRPHPWRGSLSRGWRCWAGPCYLWKAGVGPGALIAPFAVVA